MMNGVEFVHVEGYGELARAADAPSGNFALLVSHGTLYDRTVLTPPQVQVWFSGGGKVVCADMQEARVVVQAQHALEAT